MFYTPNMMIPLNDRTPGEVAEVAKKELRKYQRMAELWSVYVDYESDQISKVRHPTRCKKCDQALWFLRDKEGKGYTYTDDEIQALTVAHIRQRHPEVKP